MPALVDSHAADDVHQSHPFMKQTLQLYTIIFETLFSCKHEIHFQEHTIIHKVLNECDLPLPFNMMRTKKIHG